MLRSFAYLLVLLASCANFASAQSVAEPPATTPVLDPQSFQRAAISAARSQETTVQAAVQTLVAAGFFKGAFYDELKPMLAGSGVTLGPMTQELAVKLATQFAQANYRGNIKFKSYAFKENLHIVLFVKVGTGDLDPTFLIGLALDERGQVVGKGNSRDEGMLVRQLLPGDAGPRVW